jgi:hypothetical protein
MSQNTLPQPTLTDMSNKHVLGKEHVTVRVREAKGLCVEGSWARVGHVTVGWVSSKFDPNRENRKHDCAHFVSLRTSVSPSSWRQRGEAGIDAKMGVESELVWCA